MKVVGKGVVESSVVGPEVVNGGVEVGNADVAILEECQEGVIAVGNDVAEAPVEGSEVVKAVCRGVAEVVKLKLGKAVVIVKSVVPKEEKGIFTVGVLCFEFLAVCHGVHEILVLYDGDGECEVRVRTVLFVRGGVFVTLL